MGSNYCSVFLVNFGTLRNITSRLSKFIILIYLFYLLQKCTFFDYKKKIEIEIFNRKDNNLIDLKNKIK